MSLRMNTMAEVEALKERMKTRHRSALKEVASLCTPGRNKESKEHAQLELIFLALKLAPVREYRFHPDRKWRFDFAFPELKLAIEYEGLPLQVEKSRHTTVTGFAGDCEKYSEAAILGWRIIRVNALSMQSGVAHGLIEKGTRELRSVES